VLAALTNDAWIHDIVGALMILVMGQYLLLRQHLEAVHLEPDVEEQVIWRWCTLGLYSASLAYGATFFGSSELLGTCQLRRV
jgi:hypothetical protein